MRCTTHKNDYEIALYILGMFISVHYVRCGLMTES